MLQASTHKIPNYKHQITNKSQIQIFDIWDLLFKISSILTLQLGQSPDVVFLQEMKIMLL